MDQLFTHSPIFIIIIVFLIALFILSKSADYLTDSAIIISKYIGISDMIIGATIVSLGTSLPEFATTISALLSGSNELALGNALGSIITNTSIILGIGILYGSIPVSKKSAFNVWITFLGIGIIYLISILNHAAIPRFIGYILLITLPIFLLFSFKKGNNIDTNFQENEKKLLTGKRSHDILSELLLRNTKRQQRPARQEHIERCDENSQSNSDNQIEMQP